MYEYRVFDTVEDREVFFEDSPTLSACQDRVWYEWKYGLHSYEEGRFIIQRRPKNPRWEDVG